MSSFCLAFLQYSYQGIPFFGYFSKFGFGEFFLVSVDRYLILRFACRWIDFFSWIITAMLDLGNSKSHGLDELTSNFFNNQLAHYYKMICSNWSMFTRSLGSSVLVTKTN